MLYMVDSAPQFAKNYAARRKAAGLVIFERLIIDFAKIAGRPVQRVNCDNDAAFTSRTFQEFCVNVGIATEHVPSITPQNNGVVESAVWRASKVGQAGRRYAEPQLGYPRPRPEGRRARGKVRQVGHRGVQLVRYNRQPGRPFAAASLRGACGTVPDASLHPAGVHEGTTAS